MTVLSIALLLHAVASGAATPQLRFEPQAANFEAAAKEYREIWSTDGERMARALERATGFSFTEDVIPVVVFEGTSRSGVPGQSPMMMRASYKPEIKKGTLIHELGHRILAEHRISALTVNGEELDAHRVLFLFLYDLWVDEYGKDFADANLAAERARKGLYDYDAAWTWALKMSREQRARKFQDAKAEHR